MLAVSAMGIWVADPFFDLVLEPTFLTIAYIAYLLVISPSFYFEGVLFGLS